MHYAYKVIKWTLGGDAFDGGEIWTTGFHTGADAGDVDEAGLTEANAEAIATVWTDFFTDASTQVSDRYRTLYVKGAVWGPGLVGNNIMYGDPVYYNYATPIEGANGLPSLPPQIALAASFKSGWHSGVAANGRMYLPGINKTVENNGAISDTARGEIGDNFVTFIDGVNAATVPGDAGKLILAGQGRTLPLPIVEARNAYVTKIRIGNYYDTQRRRRNNFTETYTERGVA